jgi:DNA-binding HxlR family transcriptional regulator
MPNREYPRFCPVAMSAEIIEPRWTPLVLCEMWSGSTRFSAVQRGVETDLCYLDPGFDDDLLIEADLRALT